MSDKSKYDGRLPEPPYESCCHEIHSEQTWQDRALQAEAQLAEVTAELVQRKKDCTEHMIDHARVVTKLSRYQAALAEDQATHTANMLRDRLLSTTIATGIDFLGIAHQWLADRRRAATKE